MPVHNAEIAAIFEQTAELLEIKGDDQSRIRGYRRAARTVEALPLSVATLLERGVDPASIPGIGKDFACDVAAIVKTARFELLDSLRRQLPGELGALAAIPGLGPKRVKLLHENLRVRSLEDLRRVAQEGRLRDIRGLGVAVEKRVLTLLSRPQEVKRFSLAEMQDEIDALVAALGAGLPDTRVLVAGSIRRRRPMVKDVDLLVTGNNPAAVCERLAGSDSVADIRIHGPARTTVVLRSGPQVDLRVVAEDCYGAALLYFTGSKRHNVALRTLAGARGWKLNEYGLFAGKRKIAGEREDDIYGKLGLQFIPPELREDRGEIAEAREGRLPSLVAAADIRGDLHVRFDWHDDSADVDGLITVARTLGYRYLALVGDAQKLRQQPVDVAHMRARLQDIGRRAESDDVDVFKGIAADILPNGSLDLPVDVAGLFDFVVAGVHSQFDLPAADQTERLMGAVRDPRVAMLVLPSAPVAGRRNACTFDPDRVIAAAGEAGCLLELGVDPDRLDLDEAQVCAAKASGVAIAISPCAARPQALARMRFAVDLARRGRLSADVVANTRPPDAMRSLLAR
jgi:DNA polymerase (family 10)